MSCPYAPQIGDFLDGTLEPGAARTFQAHLAGCRECALTVDDFRSILVTARVLQRHAAPPAVWTRIEQALAAGQVEPEGRAWKWRPAFAWRPLAAAAALALVIGGVSWLGWQLVSLAPAEQRTTAAAGRPDPALVQSVETQLKLAEEHYSNAIAGLDAIAKADDSALDPQTAELLQANLTVIDDAIGQSRSALQSDPSNTLAQESLFSALQSKVSLLQNTIALINEMRKGNDAGAARIVSGMNP